MRPVFSNISYFLRTKFTFINLSFNFVWGAFETPKKFGNLNKQNLSLSLEILSNDAPKE